MSGTDDADRALSESLAADCGDLFSIAPMAVLNDGMPGQWLELIGVLRVKGYAIVATECAAEPATDLETKVRVLLEGFGPPGTALAPSAVAAAKQAVLHLVMEELSAAGMTGPLAVMIASAFAAGVKVKP